MLVFEPHHGLTHVIDKGLGPRAWEDVLEVAGDHISIIKLGWGTAAVTGNLQRKLEVLSEKPVVIGGTYFEVIYAKDKLDEYKQWLQRLGLQHVEISDGTVEIPRERKLELIADFARDFTVLSEVGSKDSSIEYTAAQWVLWLQEDLDAGAGTPAPIRRVNVGGGWAALGAQAVRRANVPDVLVAAPVVGADPHGERARAGRANRRAGHARALPGNVRDTRPARRALRPEAA